MALNAPSSLRIRLLGSRRFTSDEWDRRVEVALSAASSWHEGQSRKYTHEPYIEHPAEVARTVWDAYPVGACVCAALLHDVIEDCGAARSDIEALGLGNETCDLAEALTEVSKPSDGNRAARKALDRAALSQAPPRAKLVKLADLHSNWPSIREHAPGFAKVYGQEVRLLLSEALHVAEGDEPDAFFRGAFDLLRHRVELICPPAPTATFGMGTA